MRKIILSIFIFSILLLGGAEAWSRTQNKAQPATPTPTVAAPEPAAAPIPPSLTWADKFEIGWKRGLYFQTKDRKYSLKFRVRLQPQYQFQTNHTTDSDDTNTFKIRRAKVSWEGNLFTQKLEYKLQLSVATSNIQDLLEDAYVDYRFFNPLRTQFGQFKVPYNRQMITSSGRLEFVDRSLASEAFRFAAADPTTTTTCNLAGGQKVTGSGISCSGTGVTSTTTTTYKQRFYHYDTGFMLHGDVFNRKMEYYAGIFNGLGPNRLNVDGDFLYAGRVVYNALGQYGYSESDVEFAEHPALTLGAAAGYNKQDGLNNKLVQLGGEMGFKYRGFSTQGEYYFRENGIGSGASSHDTGYYLQAGYFIIPHHLEVAARASQVFLAAANSNKGEFIGDINYYFKDHDFKIQLDYSWLRNDVNPAKFAGDTIKNDQRIRLQAQAWF